MHEVAKQITLTLSVLLELPPLLALQYALLIQAQIVDAEFLQVMGVVSMCDHQDREDVAAVDELFYVFWAYLLKSWEHEVVGIDH